MAYVFYSGSFAHIANNLLLWGFMDRGGCVILPATSPLPASDIRCMAAQHGLTSLNMFSNFLARHLITARQDKSLLSILQGFEYVVCSGQALADEQEDWAVAQGIRLVNIFASTEGGLLMQSDREAVSTLTQFPGCSYEFIPLVDNGKIGKALLELVIPPASPDCPHPSLRHQETGKYHTGDLFLAIDSDRYYSMGRNDDWIKMECSKRCDTSSIEENVMQTCGNDLIDSVVVVGTGRPCPVLIVEPAESVVKFISDDGHTLLKREILRRIWPFHRRRYDHERIDCLALILIAPRGSLPRTPIKGNIRRKLVEKQYKSEMDRIFMLFD